MSRRLSPLFIALFLQALQVIQVTARFLLNFPVDLNLSSNILNPHPGTETWPIITPSPVFSPHRLRLTPIPSSIHLFTDAFDCDVDSYNFGDFRICPDEIWLIIDSTGYDNNSSNHAKTFNINVSSELDFSGLMDLSIQMFSFPQIPSKALLKTKTKTKTKANSQTPAAMVKSNINDHPNHDDSTSNLNFLQNSKQIPLKSSPFTSSSTSSKDRYQLVPNRDQQQQHKVTTSTSSSSESVHHRQYARIRLVENPDIIGNGKRIARRHMVVPFEISLIEVERDS